MFTGSIVALITPFDGQNRIDFEKIDRLVDYQCKNGSSGIVIAGTTGESPTLSADEFQALLKHVIARCGDRLPVLAGTGSASTEAAIRQTKLAADCGAHGALVVTPYYSRPTQEGLRQHFTAVADAVKLPLLLYNVPARTGVDLARETVAELSRHPRIVGLKESQPDMARIRWLTGSCADGFVVLSGDDDSFAEAVSNGAQGVVSVAANVAPAQVCELYQAAAAGDRHRVQALNQRLDRLFRILSIETNPIPVKWAAFELGLAGPALRLPMTQLAEPHRAEVRQCLAELELLPGAN